MRQKCWQIILQNRSTIKGSHILRLCLKLTHDFYCNSNLPDITMHGKLLTSLYNKMFESKSINRILQVLQCYS